METKGIEQTPLALSKPAISATPGAKSDARDARKDPELDLIVRRWPSLSAKARMEIVRIVEEHGEPRE